MIYVFRRDVTARYEVQVEAESEEEATTKLHNGEVLSDEEVKWDCFNEELEGVMDNEPASQIDCSETRER
tara:strand:+ start:1438 stop:1647 length:210 start_codon:yes stop_codon:yes gene_type:complete